MKKLLTSPSKMSLPAHELAIYQNILKLVAPLSLNLLAVKVTDKPEDFIGWCNELIDVCDNRINMDLLDEQQLKPLKKLSDALKSAVSVSQYRMATIAPWPFYAQFLQAQQQHAFDERCRLLKYVASLSDKTLAEMPLQDRLVIAGKHTNSHDPAVYDFDTQWFGSTKTVKAFHQLIENEPQKIDQALAHIPTSGEVSKAEYDFFVKDYVDAYQGLDDKPSLIAATRLLAMRRPDQFICLSSSKLGLITQALEIKLTDFNQYWTGLVQGIRQMHWWRSSEPQDEAELLLWQHRAIFFDMLSFADESLAGKSNFIKLRDKPKRATKSGTTTRVKRTKETAEALVDRVLSDPDIEDFIAAQRESIVAQVQQGKSIDEVLSLIRKIFS